MSGRSIPVHVEVAVRPSGQDPETLRAHVLAFLQTEPSFRVGPLELPGDSPLSSYVENIEVTQIGTSKTHAEQVSFWQAEFSVHVFSLSDLPCEIDVLPNEDGSEDMSPCSQWVLPRRDFEGLWTSLVLEPNVKERLVDYAASSLLFSRSGVREHVVTANRMVLLHGPPGRTSPRTAPFRLHLDSPRPSRHRKDYTMQGTQPKDRDQTRPLVPKVLLIV